MKTKETTWLTTGEAAALCSVTPDTILKWIKKGRIRGMRTAGGHFRVERGTIEHYIHPIPSRPGLAQVPPLPQAPPLRCWEYQSTGGLLREECRACHVYQIRATRCFHLSGTDCEAGQPGQTHRTACQDCGYYRRVKGLPTHVLVVSPDEAMIGPLQNRQHEMLTLRFAHNAYEASAIVSHFRPAFAIVDMEMLGDRKHNVIESMADDPRLPGLKIVIAVPADASPRQKEHLEQMGGAGLISMPVGIPQIANLVANFPIETHEENERSDVLRLNGKGPAPA